MTSAGRDITWSFRGYRLEPARRRLLDPDGQPVVLRAKVFDTLCELVARAGTPVSKAELLQAVWPDSVVEENNLNQAISALRQVFGDDHHDPKFIATITGRGYQFVADVRRVPVAGDDAPATRTATPHTVPPAPTRRRPALLAGAAVVAALALVLALWPRPVASPPDGPPLGGAALVTPVPGAHGQPTLSPDGTLMAFVSDRSGTPQVWVKGLPDGAPVQLTDGEAPATHPSWSPVDDVILFQRAGTDGVPAVWRVDALGTTSPRVVLPRARAPRFSTDGRRFVCQTVDGDIAVVPLDGGEARVVEGVPETPGFADPMPAMNADGDIVFVLADEGPSGNLWLYDASAARFRQLTRSDGSFAGVWASAPAWMPDGRHVIYSAAEADPANAHLWRVDVDSGRTTKLSGGAGGYDQPAVSRDGALLAYQHARPVWRIVSSDPVTGERRVLHESRTTIALPHVSADGREIVFFGESVQVLPVAGGRPQRLTSGPPGEATLPAWSRSDRALYYYKGRTLHRLDPDSGLSTEVLDDFHWSKQNWLAVHDDRLAYRVRGDSDGDGRSVLHALDTGEVRALDVDVLPTDFTRDGTALLGRDLQTSDIVVCEAPGFGCTVVRNGDEPVKGAIPRWSADERRIYFRRARPEKPGYADIWVVDRDGGAPRQVLEIGPYEPNNVFFGVSHDDRIIWNEYDRTGNSEIWLVVQAS